MTDDLAQQIGDAITRTVTTIPAQPGFRLLTVFHSADSRAEWAAGFPDVRALPIVAWRVVPDPCDQERAADGQAWAAPVTVSGGELWTPGRTVGIEAPDGTVCDLTGDDTFGDRTAFLDYARDEGRRYWDGKERTAVVARPTEPVEA